MNQKNEFKPYVSAEKITPELTVTSIIMGIILAVVFGAANAYLGLRVGMTVSASIPAAVISMGVIRVIMRKNSVLESNLVQTIGSAGESLAAGAIFTLPALFLWAKDGIMEKPSLLEITIIAVLGGLLGVLFMVPLRNALIVREHNTLPYPEGQACAEVLLAGEEGGANAGTVFAGMGIAAAFKFFIDGLKLVPSEITAKFSHVTEVAPNVHRVSGFPGQIGSQIYPAVMSVGYICGPKISSYMFSGGVVAWMIILPLIVIFSGMGLAPGAANDIVEVFAAEGGSGIWGTYIRYIGAGALAAGGIISLLKSLPLIIRTFRDSIKAMKGGVGGSQIRTDKDIDMKFIIAGIVALTLLVWLLPVIPVNFVAAIIIVIFGFFFATVSSRMVGIVGSSNNPVSGMAIATLLFATLILTFTSGELTHDVKIEIMKGAIAIGSIICIIAAIAGDTSQDLKTGYLLGATPWKQQVGEIIGVLASAVAIGGVLYLLDQAWGFGGAEIPAPQATLMKMIVEGVVDQQLPWGLVFVGVLLAVVVEILGIPVLPFAIGVYLPVALNACIMVGGVIRLFFNKMKKNKNKEAITNDGVLYCSGMIAGEGLVGILLAVFAIISVKGKSLGEIIDLSRFVSGLPEWASQLTSLATFAAMILIFLGFTLWKKRKNVAKVENKKDAE